MAKHTTPEQKKKILELARAGNMTAEQIAKEVGVNYYNIGNICKNMNVKLLSVKEVKVKFIKENYDTMSRESIIAHLDITEQHFLNLCFEAGIQVTRKPSTKTIPVENATVKQLKDRLRNIKLGISSGNIEAIEKRIIELEGLPEVKVYRGRDMYTHTSSPYGLASELFGLKLSK